MLEHVLSHLDWILSLGIGDVFAVLVSLTATVWGAIRMAARIAQGVAKGFCWGAGKTGLTKWYYKPTRMDKLEARVVKLCEAWDVPLSEPERGPWKS